MNKSDLQLAKKKILKCLTEDVTHGKQKSLGLFDGQYGYAKFSHTDLTMIMDKVVLGLYLALEDSEEERPAQPKQSTTQKRVVGGYIGGS